MNENVNENNLEEIATASDNIDEMDVFTAFTEVELKGQKYEILPMPWTTEARLLKEISPLVAGAFAAAGKRDFGIAEIFQLLVESDVEKAIAMVTKALRLATNIPEDVIETLNISELEQLVSSIIEVNKTFFISAVSRLQAQKTQTLDNIRKNKK